MIHLKNKSEDFIYQEGEVVDLTSCHAEVLLPTGRREIVSLSPEEIKNWVKESTVAVLLSKNYITRERGVHEHALTEVIPTGDKRYEDAMAKVKKTFREIGMLAEDLEALPELIQEECDEHVSQAFFSLQSGKYIKELPKYKGYELKHIIHNHAGGENRLDFMFEKMNGKNLSMRRFELVDLQKLMEKEPKEFSNIGLLEKTLPDLEQYHFEK